MSAPGPWLTTERLGLWPFTDADAGWLAALFADPEVMRHMGGAQTRRQATEFYEVRIREYSAAHPGLGIWKTVERETDLAIGLHNLNHVRGERFIQVGFILAKAAWGRGYATEMARALLRYGFVDVGLPSIAGMTSLGNLATQRVLEKIGLERCGLRTFEAYASAGPQAWFEASRDDWLARFAPASGQELPR